MPTFDDFWSVYPKRVGKGAARKAWDKAMTGCDAEALSLEIMLAVDVQKRYRQEAEAAGEFLPPWKHPSTWLNQECWLDEVPSVAALKERQKLAQCSVSGCMNEIHGPSFRVCAEHVSDTMGYTLILKRYMMDNGLWKLENESMQEWRERCRTQGLKLMAEIGL